MQYSLEEKYQKIKEQVLQEQGKDPIIILKHLMHQDYINIHGPEHHFLDGACFLMAYYNAGGTIDIEQAIDELAKRSIKMPGAMCGYWGVCGSVASLGACLSILHHTGPLSDDIYYQDHMEFSSRVIHKMSDIGGPRCCKRNAFLSISEACLFVKEKYGVELSLSPISCEFTSFNQQCIKNRCPFHR